MREIATLVLKLRAEKGIKVRQPLGLVQVCLGAKAKIDNISKPLLEILQDEVNVKKITLVAQLGNKASLAKTESGELKLALDIEITPELKHEGLARELVRQIQELRQQQGLVPQDMVKLFLGLSQNLEFLRGLSAKLKTETNSSEIKFERPKDLAGTEWELEGEKIWIVIEK